jgi:hypothetical protein
MEGRLRANMLWDSIVRYKTERGALGSKTRYPRLVPIRNRKSGAPHTVPSSGVNSEPGCTTARAMVLLDASVIARNVGRDLVFPCKPRILRFHTRARSHTRFWGRKQEDDGVKKPDTRVESAVTSQTTSVHRVASPSS